MCYGTVLSQNFLYSHLCLSFIKQEQSFVVEHKCYGAVFCLSCLKEHLSANTFPVLNSQTRFICRFLPAPSSFCTSHFRISFPVLLRARPPLTYDPHRPRMTSSRQHSSRLISITHLNFECIRKKHLTFQHSSERPTSAPVSRFSFCCFFLSEDSSRLPDCGECGVEDNRLVWDQAQTRLPVVPSEVVLGQLRVWIAR